MDGVMKTREWLHNGGVEKLINAFRDAQKHSDAFEALREDAKKLEMAQTKAYNDAAADDDALLAIDNDDDDDDDDAAPASADDADDDNDNDGAVVADDAPAPADDDNDAILMMAWCSG